MLVLGLNTKRQRRPNVRLGEIGDVSPAFSSGSFLIPRVGLEEKRWGSEPNKSKETLNPHDQVPKGRFDVRVSGHYVSPRASTEKRSPNSAEDVLEVVETDASKPRMRFGMVNRKGKLKKRRRRSISSSATSSFWHSSVNHEISSKTEKEYEYESSYDHLFTTSYGLGAQEAFKECSDHETWDIIEDAHEGNSGDSLPKNLGEEENNLPSDDGHYLGSKTGITKKTRDGSTGVNGVKEWLVELGFGKYAGIFEMHEVDEETLPLLTYEDLREMGIIAVGARRRMYTAIQLLKEPMLDKRH